MDLTDHNGSVIEPSLKPLTRSRISLARVDFSNSFARILPAHTPIMSPKSRFFPHMIACWKTVHVFYRELLPIGEICGCIPSPRLNALLSLTFKIIFTVERYFFESIYSRDWFICLPIISIPCQITQRNFFHQPPDNKQAFYDPVHQNCFNLNSGLPGWLMLSHCTLLTSRLKRTSRAARFSKILRRIRWNRNQSSSEVS